jgi:caffeoyl-CoA O-methyltransferase
MADTNSRSGRVYSTPEILAWCDETHAPHDANLARTFESPQRFGIPSIQVAPSEGKLLGILLQIIQAKRVIEIGTLAGYSAIRMARALPNDGKLWTIESEQHHADLALRAFEAAGLENHIELRLGRALDVLPTLETSGPFCAVFIDADKENYDRYGRWAAAHIRPGGLLIADNSFLFGQLLQNDARAEAMRRFHTETSLQFETVNIPTPDGLLLGVKR